MSFLLRAAQAFGLGPRRSPAQVADEIAEELALHLELRARELEEQGLAPEEARARARELFGDVERTARECARIQLGGRIMLVRIQWVVIAVLLGLLGFVSWQYLRARGELWHTEMALGIGAGVSRGLAEPEHARADALLATPSSRVVAGENGESEPEPQAESLESLVARWRASLAERPQDWREAWKLFQELLALPPDEALAALTALWPHLSVTQKQQALKAFFSERGHERILAALDLGATDAETEVQSWALRYLQDYSYQSFAEDYDAYLRWAATWRDRPLDEVLTANARMFLEELRSLSPTELEQRLIDFERLDFGRIDQAQTFRDEGALALLEAWLSHPTSPDGEFFLAATALSWADALEPDEAWLRTHVLPLMDHPDQGIASQAVRALGGPQNAWAVPELLAWLARTAPENGALSAGAMSLAEIGDPAAIPAMIGLIAANPCYETIYGIGYFGLGKLTGVSYDESHDGNWWIAWWELNKGRFPPEVSALSIPQY